ncbi:hypothetical protein [Paracoccus alcaliphilus]|uniref:hypothetical protein n=1 Tax=Paracoccus alcaliphilus TaxID=34002 RepID=UPI0023509659|nr:hypothetical protein [Paracoccus alcaliphilus]WCR20046.1 hypothetical protein JHW40_11565 [Paracoccus alcaliphilus]
MAHPLATRVRVCAAELLELAARARVPLGAIGVVVGGLDRIQMARNQCVHADIRPDQAGVNVDGVSRNQARRLALSHDMYEDLAENICAPTLPDARQRGVIRQGPFTGKHCPPDTVVQSRLLNFLAATHYRRL